MAGYGLGFGAHSLSRQYAALGENVPARVLVPSASWNGTAGSGFAAAPPVDPARTSAKPVCRLLTPPNQYFTDELVVGVWAGANHEGSLLDDLGIDRVIVHCEGASQEIGAPSFYLREDVNGNPRQELGWYVVLGHPGTDGHMQVYFEAVPKDPTMQNRIIGPFEFSPQSQLHDFEIEVAPSQSQIAGSRYPSLLGALNFLTAAGADNPLITITESITADMEVGNLYGGGQGYCTIVATQAVTFAKSGPSTGAATLFRPRVNGLWFKGSNITFDFHYASYIYHETASDRQHVFEGIGVTDSGGRYYLHLGGPKPTLYVARGNPWYLDCDISVVQDPCQNASLVKGCQLYGGNRDVATAALCVVGNTIHDWNSDEWREEHDALSVSYSGSAGTATLALSGGNETNGRVLTARQDGSIIATFTIHSGEADYFAGTNYFVANVVDWLNTLPGWSATLIDNARRAAALSTQGNRGTAFGPTDVKSGPLVLVTMFDQHGDLWAHDGVSQENLVFADNRCFDLLVQALFVNPPTAIKDCIIANNSFDLDELAPEFGLVLSQIARPASHLVVAHNSWSNQVLALRTDINFTPDPYCLIANNVLPGINWAGPADPGLTIANNHLFAGASVPSGASGTIVGGTRQSLFSDPSSGDFTPMGELLSHPKPPVVRFDGNGVARGIPAAVGAAAGGGEVAPAITSSNPSGTYLEGVAIEGVLTANKPVSWSLSGADAARVTLNAQTGDWALEPTDFESRTAYAFSFTASDSNADTDEQIIAITISDLDEIAPVLSSPQDLASGTNAASLSVETDEAGGALYWYLSSGSSAPDIATMLSGVGAIASGVQGVALAGTQAIAVTGLAANTSYFAHFLHRDGAGNDSAVLSGDGFATEPAESGAVAVESFARVLNVQLTSAQFIGAPFAVSGAAGNIVLAVVTGVQSSPLTPPDISANLGGAAMVQISGTAHSGGSLRPITAIFAASGLAAGDQSIDVAINGNLTACTIFLLEVSGLDPAALLANISSVQASGTSYSHSYTPNAAGNLIVSTLAAARGERGPFVQDSGMVLIGEASSGPGDLDAHTTYAGYQIATGITAVDVGADPANNSGAIFHVVEFNAA